MMCVCIGKMPIIFLFVSEWQEPVVQEYLNLMCSLLRSREKGAKKANDRMHARTRSQTTVVWPHGW